MGQTTKKSVSPKTSQTKILNSPPGDSTLHDNFPRQLRLAHKLKYPQLLERSLIRGSQSPPPFPSRVWLNNEKQQ